MTDIISAVRSLARFLMDAGPGESPNGGYSTENLSTSPTYSLGAEVEPISQLSGEEMGGDSAAPSTRFRIHLIVLPLFLLRNIREVCWICVITSKHVTR